METTKQDMPMYGGDLTKWNLKPGIYLALWHGFKTQEERRDTDDWGAEGPIIGPLRYCHTTYGWDIKLEFADPVAEEFYNIPFNCLKTVEDCVEFRGMQYGDWSVFGWNGKDYISPEAFGTNANPMIYTVIDLGGGLVQDIEFFTNEEQANYTFIKWLNQAYGTGFLEDQVEEAMTFNSERQDDKRDIRFFKGTANWEAGKPEKPAPAEPERYHSENEHHEFTYSWWKASVIDDLTCLGYHEWVQHQIENPEEKEEQE